MATVVCGVDVLQNEPYPLVIFPEGDVYHLNDRTMPFRHGAAVAALLACERGNRPVACVPCALKFRFTSDPSDHLEDLTNKLETHLNTMLNGRNLRVLLSLGYHLLLKKCLNYYRNLY